MIVSDQRYEPLNGLVWADTAIRHHVCVSHF